MFVYRDTYAVNGKLAEDENRKLAAWRFLYLCMSETENGVYYSGTSRVVPINRGAWKNGSTKDGSYTDGLLEVIASGSVQPVFAGSYDLDIFGKTIAESISE